MNLLSVHTQSPDFIRPQCLVQQYIFKKIHQISIKTISVQWAQITLLPFSTIIVHTAAYYRRICLLNSCDHFPEYGYNKLGQFRKFKLAHLRYELTTPRVDYIYENGGNKYSFGKQKNDKVHFNQLLSA